MFSSCVKNDCKQEFVGGITQVPEILDSCKIGQVLSIPVQATGRDGCSSFKGFEIIENEVNSKNEIWVSSKISSIGCECTMLFPSFDATLTYTCKTKGWNLIRFFNLSVAESKVDSFFVY